MRASFRLAGVGMRYNGTEVLSGVTLQFSPGELVAIVGPNGAGKSTLLSIMAGLRAGYTGECFFEGTEVRSWSRRKLARRISFVPQNLTLQFPFTAEQVVLMGRTPYCDGLFESPEDHAATERAMEITDSIGFRDRDFRSLSGGERQRAILASALAQSPAALLLDEPTTFLDLKHQLSIYKLLREQCRRGLLVIAVTHDLNLAASYCDRAVVLHRGKVTADAAPRDALHPETIRQVFEVDVELHTGPGGKPWILYGG